MSSQTSQTVLELGQFHLQLSFFGARSTREYIQDKTCAVNNFGFQSLFEVLGLTGRKFIIEDDHVHALEQDLLTQFFHLATADKRGRIRPVPPLDDLVNDA